MNLASLLNGTPRKALHTYRYTTRAVLRRENVAEHQWIVSYYSLILGMDLQRVRPICRVDYGLLLSRCCVHDIEESVTGDFLRKVKHANKEIHSAIEDLGREVVSDIGESLGHRDTILGLWENSKANDLEGQILRLADAMAVVSYVVEERQMGNRTLVDVEQEVLEHLNQGVHPHLEEEFLRDVCAETALYLCEECGISPHPSLREKVDEARERRRFTCVRSAIL